MPTQIITDLTTEQRAAVEKIIDWSRGSRQQITLGGYAGTGKTTLISHLLRTAFPDAVILAPTGKACSVLRKKGVGAHLVDPYTEQRRGRVPALIEQFGQEKTLTGYGSKGDFALFDYGWAITVHKAQGSEWNNVFVLEERPPMGSDFDQKRWRYTACTRAAKSLHFASPFTRPAERDE